MRWFPWWSLLCLLQAHRWNPCPWCCTVWPPHRPCRGTQLHLKPLLTSCRTGNRQPLIDMLHCGMESGGVFSQVTQIWFFLSYNCSFSNPQINFDASWQLLHFCIFIFFLVCACTHAHASDVDQFHIHDDNVDHNKNYESDMYFVLCVNTEMLYCGLCGLWHHVFFWMVTSVL